MPNAESVVERDIELVRNGGYQALMREERALMKSVSVLARSSASSSLAASTLLYSSDRYLHPIVTTAYVQISRGKAGEGEGKKTVHVVE